MYVCVCLRLYRKRTLLFFLAFVAVAECVSAVIVTFGVVAITVAGAVVNVIVVAFSFTIAAAMYTLLFFTSA